MRKGLLIVGLLLLVGVGWLVYSRLSQPSGSGGSQPGPGSETAAAPVGVERIGTGPIELIRVFSGSLESPAQFVVAPKVGGRVVSLSVDLSDAVERDQVVAELDDDEYVQEVAQASAELAVAEAQLAEARSSLEIAEREMGRVTTLQGRGVVSESQMDVAEADEMVKRSTVVVAEAQLTRAQSALAAAKIRLGYTKVAANWTGGDPSRVVAERFVDEGQTVAANTPLLSIVELDPIQALIYVTEQDYAGLKPDQAVILRTDAYADQTFAGKIARIAPVFRSSSRQAAVQIEVPNPDHLLKPGMFVRAQVMLDRVESATFVPVAALTRRADADGIFLINEDAHTAVWTPVQIGIQQDGRVQVLGENIAGRVVTLGHQLIEDGSPVTFPGSSEPNTPQDGGGIAP